LLAVKSAAELRTRAPMTYVIDYSTRYLDDPKEIRAFEDAPPDLMHVGKSCPVLHNWGPVPLISGENQFTGGPNHTLDRAAVCLLTPQELEGRIHRLKRYTQQWHEAGIPLLMCYSSMHTIAGDHQTRDGFWNFFDHWNDYTQWLGPKPKKDPFDWLMVDKKGALLPGACGGYTPAYFAPLHRYRVCPEHPEWRKFHVTLAKLIAEVGYDGVFQDNSTPENMECFCKHCRRNFKEFVKGIPERERGILGVAGDAADVDLLAGATSPELIRRYRIATTARWQLMVRDAGRMVNPGFQVFPNVNSYHDFMPIAESCDVLMFESTYSPGVQNGAYRTHIGQLLFTMNAAARPVLLDYECLGTGKENVLELGLAECAAFTNGGAVACRGEPLKKYHRFFRRARRLHEGLEPYADIALLYSYWGHNPGGMGLRSGDDPSPADDLSAGQRLIKVLMDRKVQRADLARLRSLVLAGHALEMTDKQVAAIADFVGRGGMLRFFRADTTVNGEPVASVFRGIWEWKQGIELPGFAPLVQAQGDARGLRFSAFVGTEERRMTLHVVNYNVSFAENPAGVRPVESVGIAIPLPRGWESESVRVHDPDAEIAETLPFTQENGALKVTLPRVRLYKVLEIMARQGCAPRNETFGITVVV